MTNCRHFVYHFDFQSKLNPMQQAEILMRDRLPHAVVRKFWEEGGMDVVSTAFDKKWHLMIENIKPEERYEFDGWPYFKLQI